MYSGCLKWNPASIYDPCGGTPRPLARLDVQPCDCQLVSVGDVFFDINSKEVAEPFACQLYGFNVAKKLCD